MSGQFLAYFIVCMPGLLAIAGACSSDIPKLLGYGETALLFEWPFKCPAVMGCKIGIGLLGVAFSCWAFYRQQYRPFKDFDELRSVTFKRTFEDQIKKLRKEKASKDLRLNIMRARHWVKLGKWIQAGRLVPIYHYDGEDRRVDRTFCFRFFRFFKYSWAQGISGRAFLTREAKAEPLDANSGNDYNLTEEMKRHTNDLTAIVSVPIVQRRGKRKYTYVGVMNVDSSTAEFAQAIRDEEYALTMARYLNDSGMYVGMWL